MNTSIESAREISAAKLRLTTARQSVSFAKQTFASATESLRIAESQLDAVRSQLQNAKNRVRITEKEVNDAVALLKEVEERWDVIDLEKEDGGGRGDKAQCRSRSRSRSRSPRVATPDVDSNIDSMPGPSRSDSVPRERQSQREKQQSESNSSGSTQQQRQKQQQHSQRGDGTRQGRESSRTSTPSPNENHQQQTRPRKRQNSTQHPRENQSQTNSSQQKHGRCDNEQNGNRQRQSSNQKSTQSTPNNEPSIQQQKIKYENNYQLALDKHYTETKRLVTQTWSTGQLIVSASSASKLRGDTFKKLRFFNYKLHQLGGVQLSNEDLMKKLSEAEEKAVTECRMEKMRGSEQHQQTHFAGNSSSAGASSSSGSSSHTGASTAVGNETGPVKGNNASSTGSQPLGEFDLNSICTVEISGCGVNTINGTYDVIECILGAPAFRKTGYRNHTIEHYTLYRQQMIGDETKCQWYLSHLPNGAPPGNAGEKTFYRSDIVSEGALPPKQGWHRCHHGNDPVLKICKYGRKSDESSSQEESQGVNECRRNENGKRQRTS